MKSIFAVILVALLANLSEAADQVDFRSQIQPIFKEHCYRCHGPNKEKADLQMHSSEGLLEHVLIPGDLESELYTRLIEEDEEMRMPEGGDPLPRESIELVRLWIEQGAPMPEGLHVEVFTEPVIEDSPPADPAALEALHATGALVLPLASGFNLLTVSFATLSDVEVNDELIAPLAGVSEQVAWLNLAGANVTDEGLLVIGGLPNLAKLHLENTQITDAGLAHLSALDKLEYLNLYGTQVTDAGLEHLKSLPKLKRLYLWQTKVNYEPAMALAASVEGLEVNLGWDHPGVRRARLTAELERATKQREDAAAREEAARQEKEDAAKREKRAARGLENLARELRGEPPLADEPEEEAEPSDDAGDDAANREDPEDPEDDDAEREDPEDPEDDDPEAEDDDDERDGQREPEGEEADADQGAEAPIDA